MASAMQTQTQMQKQMPEKLFKEKAILDKIIETLFDKIDDKISEFEFKTLFSKIASEYEMTLSDLARISVELAENLNNDDWHPLIESEILKYSFKGICLSIQLPTFNIVLRNTDNGRTLWCIFNLPNAFTTDFDSEIIYCLGIVNI